MRLSRQWPRRRRITCLWRTKQITAQSISKAPEYPRVRTTGFSARTLPTIDPTCVVLPRHYRFFGVQDYSPNDVRMGRIHGTSIPQSHGDISRMARQTVDEHIGAQ